jgi:hypothetical protein
MIGKLTPQKSYLLVSDWPASDSDSPLHDKGHH